MAIVTYFLLALAIYVVPATAKNCGKEKAPFELGEWNRLLQRLDSATIENNPVSIAEGQYYVYENTFNGHIIKYIHVDNVAQKTCGAEASLKRGGVGVSSVLLILHSKSNNEIRSVVEVWGTPIRGSRKRKSKPLERDEELKNMRSKFLFTLNHNTWSDPPSE